MPVAHALLARHSPDFVAAWRSVYCDVYRWRRHGRFAVVPSLAGRPVFAYLPGLGCSDLEAAEARELASGMGRRAYSIRALEVPAGPPAAGAPAVLRIDLKAFGRSRAAIWERALQGVARTGVRRARKAGLEVAEEAGDGPLGAFLALLSAVLDRHGAPMMPASLFRGLVDAVDARLLIVRDIDGKPVAGLLWMLDGALAWVPWWAARRDTAAGDLLVWAFVEEALGSGADVVDLGRSPVGSGPYRFKRKFGAVPVPVLWLPEGRAAPYRRYALASALWRALPNIATDAVGPRLCRYLADY